LCFHRFDADLNAAKDESSSEVQAKAKLAREKEQLQVDFAELKDKIKVSGRQKDHSVIIRCIKIVS
jgi:hypothetical protein